MPPEPNCEESLGGGAAARRDDLRRDRRDLGDELRGPAFARILRIKTIDVGEKHEPLGRDHAGHARGEAVIVAIADLACGDRVVLVDHGHCAELDQRLQGRARVQIAPAAFGILQA